MVKSIVFLLYIITCFVMEIKITCAAESVECVLNNRLTFYMLHCTFGIENLKENILT